MEVTAGKLRALARCRDKFLNVGSQELKVSAGAIFQHEGDAAAGADAGNRGRSEGKRNSIPDLAQFARNVGADRLILLLRLGALIPGLFGDEEERAVGILHAAQQAEAEHGSAALHAGRIENDLLHLPRDLRGPLQRRRVGQLQTGVNVAVIFLGQE